MSDSIRISDILGTAEVAQVLSVSKQRIHSLRKMVNFPEPVAVLASTPLWNKSDIIEFLTQWRPWKVLPDEEHEVSMP